MWHHFFQGVFKWDNMKSTDLIDLKRKTGTNNTLYAAYPNTYEYLPKSSLFGPHHGCLHTTTALRSLHFEHCCRHGQQRYRGQQLPSCADSEWANKRTSPLINVLAHNRQLVPMDEFWTNQPFVDRPTTAHALYVQPPTHRSI